MLYFYGYVTKDKRHKSIFSCHSEPVQTRRSPGKMPIPQLQSRIIYGLRSDISENAHFVSDREIMYPVGNVMVIHDYSSHKQKFFQLPSQEIDAITITANK